jgi:flagellar biosynthetic protein FlhB
MSDETDQSQKTEEPTQKKLSDGRERGQVAVSREVNTWLALLVGALVIAMMAPGFMADIRTALTPFVETPHRFAVDDAGVGQLLYAVFADVFGALFFPLLFFFLVALAGPVLQIGFVYSPKALEIKPQKISPVSGAKRLFSLRQLNEFAKGVVKLVIVGTVAILAVLPALGGLDALPRLTLPDFLANLHDLVITILVAVLAVFAVIAIIDLIFQRQQHLKTMRMTRQETKEEFKQSEGDPTVKQRLRQIRQERARTRMMRAVPEADVVVTNPTHYAVALQYRPDEMPAPKLVAKGVDTLAQRIRETAEAHDIAIIENPPLARALYAGVDLDDEVPPEHYQAVAEVISYVWSLQGRAMPEDQRRDE